MSVDLFLQLHSAASGPGKAVDERQTCETNFTKSQRDYHGQIATECLKLVEEKLGKGIFASHPERADAVRRLVAERLAPPAAASAQAALYDITTIKERIKSGISPQ